MSTNYVVFNSIAGRRGAPSAMIGSMDIMTDGRATIGAASGFRCGSWNWVNIRTFSRINSRYFRLKSILQ